MSQARDAVGGGAAGGVGGAAEDRGDVGVGQAREVVVRDGLLLLGGKSCELVREIEVAAVDHIDDRRVRHLGGR